jgi:hypothetical protein
VHVVCRSCFQRFGSGVSDGPLTCPACGHAPLGFCCLWEGKRSGCGA